jgi:anaerobic selenocysteine-containing dehydrogenase
VQTKPGSYARLESKIADELGDAEKVALVWSGPGGAGGAEPAALASALGDRVHAVYHLPATPNGRAVADAWRAAGGGDGKPERIGLLIVSGDEIARDARLRELAGNADRVVAIGMFAEELRPFADVVLPATSYLERDGTMVNLEGRVQRLRRTVMPPCPDELAWIARLAERFGLQLAPEALGVFAELSPKLFGGASLADVGERGVLRDEEAPSAPARRAAAKQKAAGGGPLRLTSYRSLFSGPAVDRVPELRFQRPDHAVELSPKDASVRGIENGDLVRVSSNGTSVELRARVNRRLLAGVVRAASEHVGGLEAGVEVTRL